jgi:Uma2 family endonuclease
MASIPTESAIQEPLPPLPPEQRPCVDHLVIEDGKPVENWFQERQMRLLVQPLYASWPGPGADRGFVAMSNVGLFYSVDLPPLVPDVLLSIDVNPPKKITFEKKVNEELAYFTWIYGKAPDVVIEVVSNRKGGETRGKWQTYHRMRVPHYVIHDPWCYLSEQPLRVLDWWPSEYRPAEGNWLSEVRLGVTVWKGHYEGLDSEVWLRWCNRRGELLLTGAEIAEAEKQRAEAEKQRADRLAEQLRRLGVQPEA